MRNAVSGPTRPRNMRTMMITRPTPSSWAVPPSYSPTVPTAETTSKTALSVDSCWVS